MLRYIHIDDGNNVLPNKVILSSADGTAVSQLCQSRRTTHRRRRFNHYRHEVAECVKNVHTYFQNDSWLSVKVQHYENTIAVQLVQLKVRSVTFQVRYFHALQFGPSFARTSIFSAPNSTKQNITQIDSRR